MSIYERMTAIAFDTLKFAKRLKEAGFTEPLCRAQCGLRVSLDWSNENSLHQTGTESCQPRFDGKSNA